MAGSQWSWIDPDAKRKSAGSWGGISRPLMWTWGRWIPPAVLALLGLISAGGLSGGPHNCLTFVMDDADSVSEIGRSWIPPEVDCRFTYGQQAWTEHQADWGYYLPIALLISAIGCAWYVAWHPAPAVRHRRTWWRHALGVLVYWATVAILLAGGFAMLWRDDSVTAPGALVGLPILSVWSLQWARRSATGWNNER